MKASRFFQNGSFFISGDRFIFTGINTSLLFSRWSWSSFQTSTEVAHPFLSFDCFFETLNFDGSSFYYWKSFTSSFYFSEGYLENMVVLFSLTLCSCSLMAHSYFFLETFEFISGRFLDIFISPFINELCGYFLSNSDSEWVGVSKAVIFFSVYL